MVTPRGLAVATWVTGKSFIASVGETVTVLSLSVLCVPKLVLALTTNKHFNDTNSMTYLF